MEHSNTSSIATRVDVFASRSSEAQLRALDLYAGFRYPSDGRPSLETQQLDKAKQVNELIAHHENLKRLLKAEKPTGVAHLFVLDPENLALGDLDAQTTLQALANAQFADARPTVAALLPPSTGFTPAAEAAVRLVKDTVLTNSAVITLESVEALRQWLAEHNGLS